MPSTTPQYQVDFRYSRRGAGVGVALYEYVPYSSYSPYQASSSSTMAFMLDGQALLTAIGTPSAGLDSGYPDDAWQNIENLLYEDSPDDGTIEDMLNDEYPGLLDVVREVLRTRQSHSLALLSQRPIRVPARREGSSDVTRAGQLVRAFLGLRGRDDVGHSVIVHRDEWQSYSGTVVYETRSWTDQFEDWYAGWCDSSPSEEPILEALSSYEIGVIR